MILKSAQRFSKSRPSGLTREIMCNQQRYLRRSPD
jgi:hypothetical protein